MSLQVVTANRLDDGLVVFYTANGQWDELLDNAVTVEADDAAQLLDKASSPENQLLVVGPYLIDVVIEDQKLIATKYREVIRTKGPTVRLDLGYQSGE